MASDIQQTPFVKQLAANDRPTRDAALASLKTYLSGRRTLAPLELLKLWKGLFYCMWMSDRPRTQQALANDLATLPSILPAETAVPFLRAFWQTMAREWTNIDVLRMEKFLLLTRRYLGAAFELMGERGWSDEAIDKHLSLLKEIPLNVLDVKIPNGMRYHVIDIYVDELQRAGALEAGNIPLEKLLEPLRTSAKESPTKDVRRKCKEALEDERLPGNEKQIQEKAVTEGEWEGIED
ncbi:MAG: hypothetical protein M1818_005251 [Claussenomyces sp. TS43310]|nr:MAG: hypothetical protein M1818_005251 [Claussenomyces sp. TS43310]